MRLVERFEWHYTPKHGSWLDLAESELGVLTSQCLDRRIPNKQILIDEIAAWEHDRNANHTKADWQGRKRPAAVIGSLALRGPQARRSALDLDFACDPRVLPSKLKIESAFSAMFCASKVLPSRLQTTP